MDVTIKTGEHMQLINEIKSIRFNIEGTSFSVELKEWNPKMKREYSYMVWMNGYKNNQFFSTIKPNKNDNIKFWDDNMPNYVKFKTLLEAEKYYSKLLQDSKNYSEGFKRVINALISIDVEGVEFS
jgi:hypothetical protein